ncbi:NAD dependent epimerase/dehydratase family protein, partial [Vibrio parahaemolyticus V-223/04]
RRFPAYGLR